MNGAVITLARWHARQVIKRQLYAKGIKLAHVESCEITIAANRYIEDHPEIIAFATEQYRRLVASGRLRPPRKLKLCSTICTATEALSCKGFSLCKYRERNETQGHERPKEIPLHDGG